MKFYALRPSTMLCAVLLLGILFAAPQNAFAQQSYGPTDFLIADFFGNRIAVYDQNLVFKGYLDTTITQAAGLDFLPNGNLVASSSALDQIRQYSSAGTMVSSFTDSRVGNPIDTKVGPPNLVYVGANTATSGVPEFTLSGTFVKSFGVGKQYTGVAVLPGGVLWAGGGTPGVIDVYSIATGLQTGTIPLDNGQGSAFSMFYSAATNTVLMGDITTSRVFERTTTGTFVRQFLPSVAGIPAGVTRGPGGDVFATSFFGGTITRWQANGTFVGATPVTPNTTAPVNIAWAGNVPASSVGTGQLLISEFRTQGIAPNDEFIELYNTTNAPIDLTNFRVEIEGGSTFIISSGSIPSKGHYLLANTDGYSLSAYAAPDFSYSGADQPANAGVRLSNFTGTIIDAVGFTSSSAAFKEGTGLAPVAALGQYSHFRSQVTTGLIQDSGNNSADFLLVSTDPVALGAGNLGGPGPQNTTSHIQKSLSEIVSRLIDQNVSATASPNRVRDASAYTDVQTPSSPTGTTGVFPVTVPNSAYTLGTLSIQRRFINNTGQSVSKLRFRVNDITTAPNVAAPIADVRLLTSNGVTRAPAVVPVGVVLRGLKLEQPPEQPFGGGYNSSVTVDLTTTPNGKLLPGEWVDVQFLLGVAKSGGYRFFIVVEAVQP